MATDPLALLPTIFGGGPGSGTLSYEQLQARRKIALAMAARQRKFPTTIGEGLTYAGERFADAIEDRRLDAAEQASTAASEQRRREYLTGDGVTPTTPPAASSSAAPPDVNVASLDPTTASPDTAAVEQLQTAIAPPAAPPAARPTSPAARPPIPIPPQVQAAMTRAFDERGVPQDMRENYYNTLAQRESRFNPNAVSSTGAKGIFQFVPGTARQYGLTGNESDPYRNTLAAIDLTNDNRNAMARALARGPTYADLALGHNQGAITAANMISGRGNASARNLAVNGVPGGMGPQQAAAFLQNKLGFDPRAQIAATMTGPPPSSGPTEAEQELLPSEVKVASLAPGIGLGGGAAPQAPVRPGGPPSPLQGAVPPAASPIMPAPPAPTPNQQFAQAQPRLGAQPDYPIMPPMSKRERDALSNATAPGASPSDQLFYAKEVERMKAERAAQHEKDKALWTAQMEEWRYRRNKAEEAASPKGRLEQRSLDERLRFGRDPAAFFTDLDKQRDSAEKSARALEANSMALDAIRRGVITGWGANMRIDGAKFAAWAFDNKLSAEQAANTDYLQSVLMSAVAASVRSFNQGQTSNVDIQLGQRAVGADPNLTTDAIKRILAVGGENNARVLDNYEQVTGRYLKGHEAEDFYRVPMKDIAPEAHVKKLIENRDNPKAIADFEDKYGVGTARLYLNRERRRSR